MTILRSVAVKISSAVNRLASSASKDWAKAMSYELEFIENDWAALRWALGGTKVLFTHHEIHVPLSSLSDVPRAAKILAQKIRRRTLGLCASALFQNVWWVWWFMRLKGSLTMRLGCVFLIAATLCVAGQAILYRERRLSPNDGLSASVTAYRFELERQRNFHSGAWLWSRVVAIMPGPLLFCFGVWLANPTLRTAIVSASIVTSFVLLSLIGVPNQLRLADTYQRRIDELDVVGREQQ